MDQSNVAKPSNDPLTPADKMEMKSNPASDFLQDESDVLVFGVNPKSGTSLQDAFLKYKTKRQKEIKKCRKRKEIPNEVRLRAMADPDRMWQLRMKFLDQIKKYFGVPYARKYWKPDEPEHSEKLFLDCCGLVRRAMRDLRKDFGFKIGPWNQCYMHDTLPITLEREEDMKPGDLVFISAIFYNPKMKKQKHNLTHVEVWVGDGPKTIGARWHRDKVRVFDHYKFESTSYHSMKFIFKSIDPWLMGICRSHCPEHDWKTRAERFHPAKKSIFSVKSSQDDLDDDEAASDTDANDVWLDRGKSAPLPQERLKKKPVALKKKPVVSVSARSTPSAMSSSSTSSGRVTVSDLEREGLLAEEDEVSIVEAETGSIARDLNEVRSPSPNLHRDFASRNPCEGKKTGISQFQANGTSSQEAKAVFASSSEVASVIDKEAHAERENVSHMISLDREIIGQLQKCSVSDASVTGSANYKSEAEKSSVSCHVECQTGSSKGGTMHQLSSSEKWKNSSNVLCYSSVYRGEASVQIKSPDILSSDSASSSDKDEGGYSSQEQSSYSSSLRHDDDNPQGNENSDDDTCARPLQLPSRRRIIGNDDDNSDSSSSAFEREEGVISHNRTASASNKQRVSSAASQRSFTQPEVGLLYVGPSGESSNAESTHSEQDHHKGDN